MKAPITAIIQSQTSSLAAAFSYRNPPKQITEDPRNTRKHSQTMITQSHNNQVTQRPKRSPISPPTTRSSTKHAQNHSSTSLDSIANSDIDTDSDDDEDYNINPNTPPRKKLDVKATPPPTVPTVTTINSSSPEDFYTTYTDPSSLQRNTPIETNNTPTSPSSDDSVTVDIEPSTPIRRSLFHDMDSDVRVILGNVGSNQTSTAADHITDKRKTHTQGLDITTNITRIRGGTANKTQQIINPTPRTNDYYGDPIIPRQDICQILSQNIQGIRDDLLFTDARLIRDEADAYQVDVLCLIEKT